MENNTQNKETISFEENISNVQNTSTIPNTPTKFCKHCGEKIPIDAVICVKCGRQVEEFNNNNNSGSNRQPIIINNSSSSSSSASASASSVSAGGGVMGSPKNKGTAILLCLCGLIGIAGLHKFYEGKILMGIIYFCTAGLCGIGTIIDLIALLGKPSTYYV